MKLSAWSLVISAMVLIVVATGPARAASCSSSITSCGCTISSPGIYTVDAPLNASQGLTARQGCIDIAASNVKLFTNSNNITGAGTGTGTGIHLLSNSSFVFVEGNHPKGGFGCTNLIGWQYGVLSEGANVISDCFQYHNNTYGVALNGAFNNNINDFCSYNNTVYGVWVKSSFFNQVNCSCAYNNGVAAVYMGCSTTGPTGVACTGNNQKSVGNFIFDQSAQRYSSTQAYGIAVETGSQNNLLTETQSNGNLINDLYDGNPNCGSNLWRVNHFTTSNQSCIQ